MMHTSERVWLMESNTNIPKNPRRVRRVTLPDGRNPVGSCGWGYYWPNGDFRGRTSGVCDAETEGRFYPAYYYAPTDTWIVWGDGIQWEDGKIAQVFPFNG